MMKNIGNLSGDCLFVLIVGCWADKTDSPEYPRAQTKDLQQWLNAKWCFTSLANKSKGDGIFCNKIEL